MTDFAQMAWLFTSAPSSRGIVRLNIAEAAMLWRYAGQAKVGMVEIGSRHGGSTCLIAGANPKITLTSIDSAPATDPKCASFLEGAPLEAIKGDSKTFCHSKPYDFAFIDGDHSYGGVKADFENLKGFLEDNATILFHDAVEGAYGTCEGVQRFTKELIAEGMLEVLETADSMMACQLSSGVDISNIHSKIKNEETPKNKIIIGSSVRKVEGCGFCSKGKWKMFLKMHL